MNRLFERDENFWSESTERQINSAAEDLVKYLFFVDEFRLESPIEGSDVFVVDFKAKAERTVDGRSLRDLDLQKRLLRYPCSYLIYSESFLALPKPMLRIVKSRILQVLDGKDNGESFKHLSSADRQNIRSILTQTHPLFIEDSQSD